MKRILIIGNLKTMIYVNNLVTLCEIKTFKSLTYKCLKYEIEKLDKINVNIIDIIIVLDSSFITSLKELLTEDTCVRAIFCLDDLEINNKNIKIYKTIKISNILKIIEKNPNVQPLKIINKIELNKKQVNIQFDKFSDMCLKKLNYFNTLPLPNIPSTSDKRAVYIELRKLPHSEVIIRNCILKLGDKWAHTIITCNENYLYYLNMSKHIHINIEVINYKINSTHNEYNNLLLTTNFWNNISSEKILIYQSDSFIFKDNISDFIEWDYIGASFSKYKMMLADNQVGNGGLSLRSKSKMLEILNTVDLKDNVYSKLVNNYKNIKKLDNYPEDIIFSQNMQTMGIGKVADYETGKKFSVDLEYNDDSFGMHCMWNGCKNWEAEFDKKNDKNDKNEINETINNIKIVTSDNLLAGTLMLHPNPNPNPNPNIYEFIKNETNLTIYLEIKSNNKNNKSYIYNNYSKNIICLDTTKKCNGNIPKKIYKIFVNDIMSKIDNDIYKYAINSWKNIYHDYDIIIYDKPKIYTYLYQHYGNLFIEIYNKLIPFAFQADFFRYCLLYKDGGIYSDLKQVALVKIDFTNKHFVAAYEKHLDLINIGIDYYPVQNCIIGCISKHPYLKSAIDLCLQNIYFEQYNLFCTDITGPVMFGRCINYVRKYLKIDETKEHFMYFFEYKDKNKIQYFINDKNDKSSNHIIKHKYDNANGADWSCLKINNNYSSLWNTRGVFNKTTIFNNIKQYNIINDETFGLYTFKDKIVLDKIQGNKLIIAIDILNNNVIDILLKLRFLKTIVFCNDNMINIDNTFIIPGNINDILDLADPDSLIITDNNTIKHNINHIMNTNSFINCNMKNILYENITPYPLIKTSFKYNIKPYFIYFPQFHQIPENDINFYNGYDDFKNLLLLNEDMNTTNLNKTLKYMETPNLNELNTNTYNLTNTSLIQRQINILEYYNLPGFAMYYYWFSKNSITNKHMIFKSVYDIFFNNIDMKKRKIFFIWANENWTGSIALSNADTFTKIENLYNKINIELNVSNLIDYFKNEAYLKIDNKPVFFIYHSFTMTDFEIELFYNILSKECIKHNFNGIHFVVNTMNLPVTEGTKYDKYNKFYMNLNYKNEIQSKKYFSNDYKSYIVDYNEYVNCGAHIKNDQINTLFYDFDNRARLFKPNKLKYSTFCINNTNFCKSLFTHNMIHSYKDKHDNEINKILLINAWNEWGEKMTFEPSTEFGYNNINLLLKYLTKY